MEKRGVVCVMVATDPFRDLAAQVSESHGLPLDRLLVVEHPLGGAPREDIVARGAGAVDALLGILTPRG